MQQSENFFSRMMRKKAGKGSILHGGMESSVMPDDKQTGLSVPFVTAAPSELGIRERGTETMNRLLFQREHLQSMALH